MQKIFCKPEARPPSRRFTSCDYQLSIVKPAVYQVITFIKLPKGGNACRGHPCWKGVLFSIPLSYHLNYHFQKKVNFINKTIFYSIIIISYFENRKLPLRYKSTPIGLMGSNGVRHIKISTEKYYYNANRFFGNC